MMRRAQTKAFQSVRSVSPIAMVLLLLIGFGLRVAYLTVDRFHADEALYAGWALLILDGDPLLLSVPVDKPPFYLYTLAGSMRIFGSSEAAARMPGLAASVLGIALTYRLGRRLYDRRTGLWAALLVTLSPYDILFARTAFTDPVLVAWMLGALCAAVEGHWFWAGLGMGMAFATKQHAVLLIPLVVAAGWIVARSSRSGSKNELLATILGFAIPCGLIVAWDSARWGIRPGYWAQSAMSYGGLAWAAPGTWGERLVEWLTWARILLGSAVLNLFLLLGGGVLLVRGWRRQPGREVGDDRSDRMKLATGFGQERLTWLDTLLAAYVAGYLVLHVVLEFSIWDRYLLPLVPLLALLMGRIVVQIPPWLASVRQVHVALMATVCLAALLCGWRAAHNGYPVGGDHWAYQGLDEVAAYLKQNAPSDAVLYHHWLRWHYTYYLYGTDFELRWWQSGEHLKREAMRTPERAQYIVLPDWRTLEPDAEGVHLRPVYETRRQDGRVSMCVYRIELDPAKTVTAQRAAYE
jgi:4-amino-4-deoxy-L-arabinose transferase-like glycosyltransferase